LLPEMLRHTAEIFDIKSPAKAQYSVNEHNIHSSRILASSEGSVFFFRATVAFERKDPHSLRLQRLKAAVTANDRRRVPQPARHRAATAISPAMRALSINSQPGHGSSAAWPFVSPNRVIVVTLIDVSTCRRDRDRAGIIIQSFPTGAG
jgi:hypothetical protein